MWAMKTTREWEGEDGVVHQEEYVEIQQSWYDVGVEGLVGVWVAFWTGLAMLCFTPFVMVQTAYRQLRYANCPVPQNEVRERAHFG